MDKQDKKIIPITRARTGRKPKPMLPDIPPGSDDPKARLAETYLIRRMKISEDDGITVRVTLKQGRYYVTEWRITRTTFFGGIMDTPIARIAPLRGKKDGWELAWMMRDLKWHPLGEDYQGSFERCLEMIVEDSDCCFWG